MAIDPSIPFRALIPTVPLENPQDVQAKALGIRNLMQQNQMGGLQLQEAQQQQQDEQAVRNLFAQNPQVTDEQILQKLGGSKLAQGLVTARQKARADAEAYRKNKIENDIAETNLVGSHANTVKAAQYDPSAFNDMLTSLQTHGVNMPFDQMRQAVAQDPSSVQKITDSLIQGSDKQRELLANESKAKSDADKTAREQTEFNQKQAQEKAGVLIQGSEFTDAKQQRNGWFRVLQPDGTYTTERRVLGQEGAPPKAPKEPEPGKDIPFPPDVQKQKVEIAGATAAARAAATKGPEVQIEPGSKEFRTAQDLAYGKLPLADFQRMYGRAASNANLKVALYDKARELNPQFNPAAYEMGFKLASNPKVQQQLASMDNVMTAVPDLLKLSDAATRTGIAKLNDFIIKGGAQIGNKKYSNLQTARTAFADELSGALGFGSATDMSKEMGLDMTRTDLSPDAFRSAIQDVVVPFIERKRDTLLKQMGPYGGSDFNPAAPKPASSTTTGGKVLTDGLILKNMQNNPKATRADIINALKAAGYAEQQ